MATTARKALPVAEGSKNTSRDPQTIQEAAAAVAGVTPEDLDGLAPQATITALGRTIPVRMPTIDQLMALEETCSAMSPDAPNIEYPEVKRIADRFFRIIGGLFVEEADRMWLAHGRDDGTVSVQHEATIDIAIQVIDIFKERVPGQAPNRAAKRAASRARKKA